MNLCPSFCDSCVTLFIKTYKHIYKYLWFCLLSAPLFNLNSINFGVTVKMNNFRSLDNNPFSLSAAPTPLSTFSASSSVDLHRDLSRSKTTTASTLASSESMVLPSTTPATAFAAQPLSGLSATHPRSNFDFVISKSGYKDEEEDANNEEEFMAGAAPFSPSIHSQILNQERLDHQNYHYGGGSGSDGGRSTSSSIETQHDDLHLHLHLKSQDHESKDARLNSLILNDSAGSESSLTALTPALHRTSLWLAATAAANMGLGLAENDDAWEWPSAAMAGNDTMQFETPAQHQQHQQQQYLEKEEEKVEGNYERYLELLSETASAAHMRVLVQGLGDFEMA